MKHLTRWLAAAALAAPLLAAAQAQAGKQIHLIVPYPAGGTTDAMARVLQEPLQKALGQQILIENKPGASGVLAAREVARSKPDGLTLFFVNSGIVSVTPQVVKDAGFDGVKDFAPVALVSTAPLMVVVPADLPVSDLKGFIAWAKAQPDPVPYASAGIGSFGHLASELFARNAGLKMTHVPYKGQAPTTNAIVAGEVKMLITTASGVMNEFIANGKLKLLAVTSAEPSPLAPRAPTVGSVLPGYVAETWFAIMAAAGTPADVVARLNDAVNKSLQPAEMQQRFTGFGLVAKTATPQRVGEMVAEEVARWGPVIRDNAIRTD